MIKEEDKEKELKEEKSRIEEQDKKDEIDNLQDLYKEVFRMRTFKRRILL